MKSLILKDLLNIGHNAKSMFFMLLVFACITIPQGGVETCIVASGILEQFYEKLLGDYQ